MLREAATMRREYLGTGDAETGVAILNHALVRLSLGDIDEAATLAAESVAIQRSLADSSDPLAQGLAGLGVIRYAQGRPGEARELLLQALEMFGPATKRTVLSVALAGRHLAEIDLESANLDAAKRAYVAAESTLREHVPDGHPDLVQLRVALDLLACRTGSGGEAAESIQSARPLLVRALGAAHPDVEEIDLAVEQCLAFQQTASIDPD